MRIGRLYFTWINPAEKELIITAVQNILYHNQETRSIVARMARSEVKNYLADLAEQAEVPFHTPAEFISGVKETL